MACGTVRWRAWPPLSWPVRSQQHYSGLISLASSPNADTDSFPVGYPIFMINGTEDDRFPIDQAIL